MFEIAIYVTHVALYAELVPVRLHSEGVLVEVLEASLVHILQRCCHSWELLSGWVREENVPF